MVESGLGENVTRLEDVVSGKYARALQPVAQLADVAWPRVARESRQGVLRQLPGRLPVPGRNFLQEALGQWLDLSDTLA